MTRTLTVKARTSFALAVATVLTLAIPYSDPAQASHPPNSSLEVLEEIDTNPSGSTHTLTAQLFQDDTGNPATTSLVGGSVNVDFEVEQGPAIRSGCTPAGQSCVGGSTSNDGNTPDTPDMTCTILGGSSSCVVTFTSDSAGTNIIRAFIDDLPANDGAANPTYDGAEGRYAGPSDCGTNAGGGGRTTSPVGPGAGERCDFNPETGQPLTPVPGAAEPDTTDVVQKTWTQTVSGTTCIDVDPNDDVNPSGTQHEITAHVTSAASRSASNTSQASDDSCGGLPRANIEVEFSLNDGDTGITGSDDPNAFFSFVNDDPTNSSGPGPDKVTCMTDLQGDCSVTIRTVQITATGDNYVIGRVPGATGGTGGPCSNATFPGGTGGTGTGANNSCTAEVVRKAWASPGTVTQVNATPEEDTNEIGTSHVVTATAGNALGTGVSGQTLIFDVTAGVNAASNLDNNSATPGGFFGQCTTNASGSCSAAYTSQIVGQDTITVCIDANANFTCDPGESNSGNSVSGDANDDQVLKHWVPQGSGASQLSLDMEGCNGNTLNPDDASWDATATSNEVTDDRNDAHAVCAAAFSSNDTLVRTPVTFTITGGPGTFVVPATTNDSTLEEGSEEDLGRTVTVDPGTCSQGASGPGNAPRQGTGAGSGNYACAFLLSDTTGSTQISACVQGSTTICDTGAKPWHTTVQNARHVAVTPETATNDPGEAHTVTATVTDRFDNRVPGVNVTWSRSGAGTLTTQETTTNAQGQANAIVDSDTEGTATVTATIPGASTDCDEAANAPANREGSTAGNCTDSATKTWAEQAPQCSDGDDNDGDGRIDFPDDPGCSSDSDDDESDDQGRRCAGRPEGPNVIIGTSGDDVLRGGDGDDVICGLGGKDTLIGRGGDDLLLGGGRNDILRGSSGNDRLRGQDGEDTLQGGSGADHMNGGIDDDIMRGGGGNDTLVGKGGKDVLRGRGGNDTLKGGGGNDSLNGGRGRDTLRGGRGRDTCVAGDGRDTVRGCEVTP